MKERGIIFQDWEVRAILDDRKTVTRRLIKPQPCEEMDGEIINQGSPGEIQYGPEWVPVWPPGHRLAGRIVHGNQCPYGIPCDRLWAREAWREAMTEDGHRCCAYRADGSYQCGKRQPPDADRICKWRPSIHMPRWASRIILEITDVRPERVRDISDEDVLREGFRMNNVAIFRFGYQGAFAQLWDSIHGPGAWDRNDWVWRIAFRRVK